MNSDLCESKQTGLWDWALAGTNKKAVCKALMKTCLTATSLEDKHHPQCREQYDSPHTYTHTHTATIVFHVNLMLNKCQAKDL